MYYSEKWQRRRKVAKKKNDYSQLELEILGCPITVAFGGLHGARKNIVCRSDEQRIILNYDVALTLWGN